MLYSKYRDFSKKNLIVKNKTANCLNTNTYKEKYIL